MPVCFDLFILRDMEHLHFDELNKGEEVTIEKLAVMIGKGFAHVDSRFDEVEKRFGGIDTRLGHLDTRVDHMDARLGRIEADLHELRDEIVYRHEFEDVLDRVKYLEKKLGIDSGMQTRFAS